MQISLPHPHLTAIAHSDQLLGHIFSEIQKNQGAISFADYMHLALYTPGLGYYSAGAEKFNARGDFITAPEISPIFSECLANQCQQILKSLHKPGDILELGAGTGKMAADILCHLEKQNSLPQTYFILEPSADLKKRQQETLQFNCPHLYSSVEWLDYLPTENFCGVILANEVLDAMPVHRFEINDDLLFEIMVTQKNNQLQTLKKETEHKELLALYQSQDWPSLYTSEINLSLKPWMNSLSDILETGVILLIDYGFPQSEYYHPDRTMGTLNCHYRHHSHSDPFYYPGLQDITAHVDFSSLKEAAIQSDLILAGYTNQAAFLLGCGLIELIKNNKDNVKMEPKKVATNHAIHLLTSPAEMGELFKVIAFSRDFDDPLLGFRLKDYQDRL
jgi:SAM-dependent MidA family methyltransferase